LQKARFCTDLLTGAEMPVPQSTMAAEKYGGIIVKMKHE